MILRLKTRESRSPPGLQIASHTSLLFDLQKPRPVKTDGAFCVRTSRRTSPAEDRPGRVGGRAGRRRAACRRPQTGGRTPPDREGDGRPPAIPPPPRVGTARTLHARIEKRAGSKGRPRKTSRPAPSDPVARDEPPIQMPRRMAQNRHHHGQTHQKRNAPGHQKAGDQKTP